MTKSYKYLFSMQLLHNYFMDNNSRDLLAVPDSATAAMLAASDVVWRQIDNKLIFLMACDKDGAPSRPFDEKAVLRFKLSVNNSKFQNYTNLTGRTRGVGYYFSNANSNVLNGVSYLSKPIEAYSSDGHYTLGQIRSEAGNFYEMVNPPAGGGSQQNPAASNYQFVADTSNYQFIPSASSSSFSVSASSSSAYDGGTMQWFDRGADRAFVTDTDLIPVVAGSLNYALGADVTAVTITISAYNPSLSTYTQVTNPPIYQAYNSPGVSACNISLKGLSTGLYTVQVNSDDQQLIFVDSAREFNGLGVIEIYPYETTPAYALFSGFSSSSGSSGSSGTSGIMDLWVGSNPSFAIQFANSMAYWQYVANGPIETQPFTDVVFGNIEFDISTDAQTGYALYHSSLMIPLAEGVYNNASTPTKVYPQANGPPDWIPLPMPRVDYLVGLDPGIDGPAGALVSKNYLKI